MNMIAPTATALAILGMKGFYRILSSCHCQGKYGMCPNTVRMFILKMVFFLMLKLLDKVMDLHTPDYPFKYLDEFRRYERDARGNNRGLWNK
jgi:hypothetical protein